MSHLMKYTEWESAAGWHSGDVSDLAHNSNSWWYPARLLDMSPADYILFLKEKYSVHDFVYFKEKNLLLWSWTKKDCHAFTLFINSISRKKNFIIC